MMNLKYKNDLKLSKIENIRLKLFLISTVVIIISIITANIRLYANSVQNQVDAEKISIDAGAFVVIDGDSNSVLYGENIHERLPMASTTKIMTAILAIENLNLEKFIKINKNAIGVEGSSIYLASDKMYKIKDLVYGLMLRSGNDAAEALAYEVSRSIDQFAKLMNDKVKQLNLKNTNFMNPHGLHHENHYTSAYDLAIITSYALKNPIFLDVVSSKMHIVDGEDAIYYNKNKLLSQYDGANGVKTGYTKISGKCLVSSAKRYGKQVIGVVLNCPKTWECSKKLLDFAFSRYKILCIKKKGQLIFDDNDIKISTNEDIYIAVNQNDRLDVTFKIKLNEGLGGKINKNTEIGYLDVYVDNYLLFSKNIYNIDTIENSEEINKLKSLIYEFNYGENQ